MIKIDVYSDIACPWCYIGKKRLDAALARRPKLQVEKHWRPFQLRPEMPQEGIAWPEFVVSKFGGQERAEPIFARVTETGASDGINFRFDLMKRAPNTSDAHRLVLFAAESGLQWAIAGALYAAYFEQGRDVGDLEVLAKVMAQLGLDPREVKDYLSGDENRERVDASQETAYNLGISGVPFYVINDRYGISGAQPVELFVAALDRLGHLDTAA